MIKGVRMKSYRYLENISKLLLKLANYSLLVFLFMAVRVFAAGGDLVWDDMFDNGGGLNQAEAIVVNGDQVFAAGYGYTARPDFIQQFVIRAYNAKTGQLSWDDGFSNGGVGINQALAVTAHSEMVYAAGMGETNENKTEFIVRAYNSKTGILKWSDNYEAGGGSNKANAITASNNIVYAAGEGDNITGVCQFIVRAYDSQTGSLVWNDQFDTGFLGGGANAIAIDANNLYVAGTACGDECVGEFVVRSYNSKTGELLWSDEFDNDGKGGLGANDIAVIGNRVIAVGSVFTNTGNLAFLVRAYDAKTGELVWENQEPNNPLVNTPFTVTINKNMVYAAGFIFPLSGPVVFLVRAYDSKTGSLVWEDNFDNGASGSCTSAFDISAKGRRVYVAGYVSTGINPTECESDFVVRTYDSRTGTLAWQDQYSSGGDDNFAKAITVKGNFVYAAGQGQTSDEDKDFIIRTYRAR